MIKVKKERVLIRPKDIKPSSPLFEILGTFNPAVARLKNGDIVMYVRVLEKLIKTEDDKYFYAPRLIGTDAYKLKIDRFKKDLVTDHSELDFLFKNGTKRLTFISHFRKVVLDSSGFKVKSIDEKPSFFGVKWDGELGIEDPRITKLGDIFLMTYVNLSRSENISSSYAISNDGLHWYRRGIIFREQNKDVVIFPEIVNKKYVAFDRPEGNFQFTPPHIWISYSKDLEYWGKPRALIFSKKGEWDFGRVGAGPPPIKTDKGWLLIYHGILDIKNRKFKSYSDKLMHFMYVLLGKYQENDTVYCAGAALFDINKPEKLIAKSRHPIIFPRRSYEKSFEDKKVIFPTGIVPDVQPNNILLYCGAGDMYVSVKKIRLKDIFKKLEKVDPEEFG